MNYPLPTGAADSERLDLLDDVYGDATRRILQQIGAGPDLHVVDLGCGSGTVSTWLAEQVGSGGSVTGVDLASDQLRLTEQRAHDAGLDNVRTVQADVSDTGLPGATFDLVYCRFVLSHLRDPVSVLREAARLAGPGGHVVCFEVDVSGLASRPETAAYRRLCEVVLAAGHAHGIDYEIGARLHTLFRTAGLDVTGMDQIHPLYLGSERKALWERTFHAVQQHIVGSGVITSEEFRALMREVAAVTSNGLIAIAQSRLVACWGRVEQST
ncbi:class I SAM-dependent methyltransferase [Nocardia sp. NPDC051052]|uniref:class I SAM-dependent methyltransferase n=1 Tax=Nocardia sp. NPDC051052 TaxID=3364322 RepID=UPI00378B6E38